MKRFLGVLFGVMVAVCTFGTDAMAVASEPWYWPIPSSTAINGGYSSDHFGIDIGAAIGAPIYAPTDGTIYKKYTGCVRYGGLGTPCRSAGAGCNPNHGYGPKAPCIGYCNYGYGNGICLKTGDGYYVQFAHMQSVNDSLYEGQSVARGTLLGYVGGSGFAEGKHCHYQVGTSEFEGTINPQSISYVYTMQITYSNISIEKRAFQVGENVTFTMSSDAASYYWVGINDANGNRIDTHETGSGVSKYTRSFSTPGIYSCYASAVNSNGYLDSNVIYFTVYDKKPGTSKITTDHYSYQVGEEVTFTMSSDTAVSYWVGINDANGNRVDTHNTELNETTYQRSFTTPGR